MSLNLNQTKVGFLWVPLWPPNCHSKPGISFNLTLADIVESKDGREVLFELAFCYISSYRNTDGSWTFKANLGDSQKPHKNIVD